MNSSEYLGIKTGSKAEIKRSSSKFLGFLEPAASEEEAEAILARFREEYSDATHVCYAMILGTDRQFQKFSDAGEPSNSAGRPIINTLLSSGISFALGVVVRYYGGKKLGIPGLIEAYGTCIQECLNQCTIEKIELKDSIKCSIAPENQYHLFNFLNQNGYEYEFDQTSFVITCSQSMTAELLRSLSNIPTLLLVQ